METGNISSKAQVKKETKDKQRGCRQVKQASWFSDQKYVEHPPQTTILLWGLQRKG